MSAQRATTDELLQPTLSADFDVHAYRRPWNPRNLIWSGFLGGPLSGGVLVALNHRRLNQPRQALVALAFTIACCIALAVGLALWGPLLDGPNGRRSVRFAISAVGSVLTLVLAAPQNKRFEAYTAAGLAPGKLLWPALAAIVGLGLLQAGFILLVAHAFASLEP